MSVRLLRTGDDVRLRLRHTGCETRMGSRLLAHRICFFASLLCLGFGVSACGSWLLVQQEPGCVTCGAAGELVRQGPPSTWHRSTQPTNHPPTCSGRLASAATTTSTVPRPPQHRKLC